MTEQKVNKPHSVSLENRERMRLTGVSDVRSYDSGRIVLMTTLGGLVIGGRELKILKMNTESGDADVEGKIAALEYSDTLTEKGFFKKLFR